MDAYDNQYPDAINVLEAGFEDSLQFYAFQRIDHSKTPSTNILDRLNREMQRRTSVVGISLVWILCSSSDYLSYRIL